MKFNPCRLLLAPALLLTLLSSLHADITLRYKNSLKPGGMLPPAMWSAMSGTAAPFPASAAVYVKGAMARSEDTPPIEIIDVKQRLITLLDVAHRRFTTAPVADYETQLEANTPAPVLPPAALLAMGAMKFAVATHPTGRIDTILGIQAQETDYTVTVTQPAGAAGNVLRLELQVWDVLPSEYARLPALAQLGAFGQLESELSNPLLAYQLFISQLPGSLRDGLTAAITSMNDDDSIMLRLHATLYMPLMANMIASFVAAKAGANSPQAAVSALDPTAPLGEMSTEATELSYAPLDDSLFAVPSGFQRQPLPDLLNAMKAAATERSPSKQ